MQSYTTQSHQRNYQGKVVLPTPGSATAAQPKRHKTLGKFATTALALALVATGGIWGVTTLHNQPLHHPTAATVVQIENYHTTNFNPPVSTDGDQNEHHLPHAISNREHETGTMPGLTRAR